MEKTRSRKSNCSLLKVKGVYRKDITRLLTAIQSERTRGNRHKLQQKTFQEDT